MREYLVIFLLSGAVTYLLTVVAREIALRTGAVAPVRDRDVHARPVPYLGGLAMLGGIVAAYFVGREMPFLSNSTPFVFPDARAVVIAGAVVCGVGVLDDIFDLDALTKFGGQVVAVAILVLSGIQYSFIYTPDGRVFALDGSQGALLTAVIVLATVNAVNFVDGLDGLAAGVVGISAAAFFLYCYEVASLNDIGLVSTGALLSAALSGACAGFLAHNFHPARLFMGDSGSMLIGLVLSASSITLTRQFGSGDIAHGADGARASLLPMLMPFAMPIVILIVPLGDLVLAVVRRTRAGRSPFAPDKQHLHHRLLEIGHSHRRAVLIMWLWAGVIAFGAVFVSLYSGPRVLVGVAVALVVALALTFLLPRASGPAVEVAQSLLGEEPPPEPGLEPVSAEQPGQVGFAGAEPEPEAETEPADVPVDAGVRSSAGVPADRPTQA